MAEQTVTIKLVWENNKLFKMTSKEDELTSYTIFQADENNHLVKNWEQVKKICNSYLDTQLDKIGKAMAQS